MLTEHNISAPTEQVLLSARYEVLGTSPFELRVGQASAELLSEHKAHRASSSTFFTGVDCLDPSSDPAKKIARHKALQHELAWRSLIFIEACTRHPSDNSQCDEGFLVFDLTPAAAMVLGERFEQRAILWCDSEAIPQLLLLK